MNPGVTVPSDQPIRFLKMEFPERFAALRKEHKLTQQALADKVDVHLSQIRRYEGGETQPTLEAIRKLAIALSVSADVLIFGTNERNREDELRLQFEALSQFSPEDKRIAKAAIESLILKHDAGRFSSTR